jgi:type II restriction/modification system DNA methylase subunit YeeA
MTKRTPALTPQEFVYKWRRSTLKERSASQEHFLDLCRMLAHPTPAQADPEGASFTFEKGASKLNGGEGWADVWKKGFFAWEYKGKHKNLQRAYEQLQLYRDDLLNPPLLIVSDMETIVIHTNFTNTVKQTFTIRLDDLLAPHGIETLGNAFFHPDRLQAEETPESVTKQAAMEFSKLAESLRKMGHDSEKAAHFLIRILFCLFAEDIGLLPNDLFTKLVEATKDDPERFDDLLRNLFEQMADGGFFYLDRIPHFNGGLFDSTDTLPLDREGLQTLSRVAQLDWSSIEPSILGTLFERGLDPRKRAQLGAHYTSREDILLIVEPVLMRPLRRQWEDVKRQAEELYKKWQTADSAGGAKRRARNRLQKLLHAFADQIADTKVLDPACGSGNFLYVALRQLLDLEKEVIALGTSYGFPISAPITDPRQLYGIEINEYAHELAQATIWIGYIQWFHENGFGWPSEPILKKLDNIKHMDAILAFDRDSKAIEPEWPEADIAIGNPPFLGGKLLRAELGDVRVDHLFRLWDGRVARESDICCYWFEKARAMIESGKLRRAGLLATQGIRGGANRKTLQRIKETGDIFWAQSDREWVLDGAAVHVSMVGFDDAAETERTLDGNVVQTVNSNLTGALDVTQAKRLPENRGIAFMGDTKVGPFEINETKAAEMLASRGNPNGAPNSDVVRPWANGKEITRRPQRMWIVDFPPGTPEHEAAQYEKPYEQIAKHVRPYRASARSGDRTGVPWWIHQRPRPDMRKQLELLERFAATARVAKHRLFTWFGSQVLPDCQLIVFAREDDYFFGVLHSKVHELWARQQGTQLRERESGFRYTPTTCFETFPFPWPPGEEPTDDARVQAIAAAAKELVEKRDRWLNPECATDAELKKRAPPGSTSPTRSSMKPSSTPTPGRMTSPMRKFSNG